MVRESRIAEVNRNPFFNCRVSCREDKVDNILTFSQTDIIRFKIDFTDAVIVISATKNHIAYLASFDKRHMKRLSDIGIKRNFTATDDPYRTAHAAAEMIYRRIAGFKDAPSTPALEDVLEKIIQTYD